MERGSRWAHLLVSLTPLGLWACGGAPGPSAGPTNVVVVLVDTLRADHLHSYGYGRTTSAHLDAFAARNLLFENHRAQAPCTYPSVNSLLTSRYPSQFTNEAELYLGIPPTVPTLAQILKAEGYTTLAVSASPIVRNQPTAENPDGGFGAGFDIFLEDCTKGEAACVNQALEGHLDALAPPFLLYLHYFDPHAPYFPPPGYRGLHGPRYTGGKEWVAKGSPSPLAYMIYDDGPQVSYSQEDLAALRDRYDDEITYFDTRFRDLLDLLSQRGWLEDSIVAVVSDHGEAFLEKEDVEHCRTLFDSEIRTPLLLQLPGVEGPRRFREVTQNLDLVPTLLDYLDLGPGYYHFEGRSLRPVIEERRPVNEASFATMDFLRAVADDRFKLILELREHRFTLYDFEQDPGESVDLMERNPRDFRRLQSLLLSWIEAHDPQADQMLGGAGRIQERLRSLGYLK